MAGKRNHPQIRATNASHLALQARDRQMLLGVHKYRLLSRKQIQLLFGFNSLTRVNTRLRQLFDAKFLDRIFVPTFWGSPEAYYCLGISGIIEVANATQEDLLEIKRKRRQALKTSELFLKHLIAVNQVSIAFELDLGENLEYFTDNIQLISRNGKVFKPDGYLVLSYGNKIYPLFLEVDLATESLQRIQEKVETYLAFGLSGEYERLFKHKYFRVLFICPSSIRLQNIKNVIEKKTNKMFWLTEISSISTQTIFNCIWQRPQREGLFSLIELGKK